MRIQSRLQNGSDPIMSYITHDFYTHTLSKYLEYTLLYSLFDRNMILPDRQLQSAPKKGRKILELVSTNFLAIIYHD